MLCIHKTGCLCSIASLLSFLFWKKWPWKEGYTMTVNVMLYSREVDENTAALNCHQKEEACTAPDTHPWTTRDVLFCFYSNWGPFLSLRWPGLSKQRVVKPSDSRPAAALPSNNLEAFFMTVFLSWGYSHVRTFLQEMTSPPLLLI